MHQVWQQKNGINFWKMPGNLLFVSYWICLGCVTFWKILVTNEENIALISESFIWNHVSHAVEFGIYWFVLRVLRSVDFRSMPHDSTLFDWRYADPQLCVACEMFHNKINENLFFYCFRWWSHISSVWTQTGIFFHQACDVIKGSPRNLALICVEWFKLQISFIFVSLLHL